MLPSLQNHIKKSLKYEVLRFFSFVDGTTQPTWAQTSSMYAISTVIKVVSTSSRNKTFQTIHLFSA